ncbi:MAG: AsmA-like C-terminal region-containing protein, partial [Stellaceae bacterium]
ATEDAIVRGLGGRGSLSITNGAIAGADLGAVARVLQSTLTGQLLNGAIGGNAHTQFRSAAASFTIRNGVVRTNDLRLTSSVLAMTGSGTVGLATHQIDFHLDPRAGRGIPGLSLVDIGIPFYVRGNWDDPRYTPDAAGLAKGLLGAVGNRARGLPSLPGKILGAPGNLVRSLFGN